MQEGKRLKSNELFAVYKRRKYLMNSINNVPQFAMVKPQSNVQFGNNDNNPQEPNIDDIRKFIEELELQGFKGDDNDGPKDPSFLDKLMGMVPDEVLDQLPVSREELEMYKMMLPGSLAEVKEMLPGSVEEEEMMLPPGTLDSVPESVKDMINKFLGGNKE